MKLVLAATLVLAAARLFIASAYATQIPVVNSGFETPATISATAPTGWTVFNSGSGGAIGSYNPYEFGGGNVYYTGANPITDPNNGGSGYPGIFGENLGYAFNVGAGSGLEQTLSATFLADTSYTFTVDEGNRNGTDAGGFAGSLIELLAGSTVVASSTDTVGPTAGTFRDQVATLSNSDSFSALFGQTLSIDILTTNPAALDRASDWDNIRLAASAQTTAVPQPTPVAMGAIGILAILGFAWRRKNAMTN
jgi:hypothetical protein